MRVTTDTNWTKEIPEGSYDFQKMTNNGSVYIYRGAAGATPSIDDAMLIDNYVTYPIRLTIKSGEVARLYGDRVNVGYWPVG